MTRQIFQFRTHSTTTTLLVVLLSFLLLLAARVQAQEAEPLVEQDMVLEAVMVDDVAIVLDSVTERDEVRTVLDTSREALRGVRAEYLQAVQAGDTVPQPVLTREQQMQLLIHIDNAAGKMRASLENTQRVARELTAIMQRLDTERNVYVQSGVDVLREVSDRHSVVSADIGEFSNLANLMLKTDNPATYMKDVRAYAELIAQELELMREAMYEAAELSRENI